MKNLFIFIAIVAVIFITMKIKSGPSNSPSKIPAPVQQAAMTVEMKDMGKINYSISNLPENIMNYLKNNSEYKDYLDRKLVIYFTGAHCPYGQAFSNALNQYRKNHALDATYNYYAVDTSSMTMKRFNSNEETQLDINFSNTCHEFCIVNPGNSQILAIEGVGYEEAEKIESILNQLEKW